MQGFRLRARRVGIGDALYVAGLVAMQTRRLGRTLADDAKRDGAVGSVLVLLPLGPSYALPLGSGSE